MKTREFPEYSYKDEIQLRRCIDCGQELPTDEDTSYCRKCYEERRKN